MRKDIMTIRIPLVALSASALLAVVVLGGCASRKFVRIELSDLETRSSTRIEEVEDQVEINQTRVDENEERINENEEVLALASKTAREAYDRAMAAGKLAEGKLLYETVLANDQVRFQFEKADLELEATIALDDFASKVKEENKNVFIEIQGHTDSSGEAPYNMNLGEKRAEAVRRYLSQEQGLPLHRMSIISYGESEPIADNSTAAGRAHNRRVVLVVLQ